jgi:hypothetical protein
VAAGATPPARAAGGNRLLDAVDLLLTIAGVDLMRGYRVERPDVLVPWGIDERSLHALLPAVHHVTDGYDTLDVVSLGGLAHALGFHCDPRVGGRLVEFEIFRKEAMDLRASYAEYERHLELAFGPPTRSTPGDEGFPSNEWSLDGAAIAHYVFDRFGPEEHVRIRRV